MSGAPREGGAAGEPRALEPAGLVLRPDGTASSPRFGDMYQPDADGGQARAVFLAGNDLPRRWERAPRERPFVLLELGIGTGLNLRETWRAWRTAGRPCALRYVGLEGFPLDAAELAAAARARAAACGAPEDGDDERQIAAAWPAPRAGWHVLPLDEPRLEVALWHGDFARGLDELVGPVDAVFLDGFSPARNPDAWRPELLERLGALVPAGGTAATWSVAGAVRRGLEAAGFEVRRRPGHGPKRERLEAVRRA